MAVKTRRADVWRSFIWGAVRGVGLALAALTLAFFLSAWIGALIPRNADWVEPDPQAEATIPIMIGTNGVHTEIVMPNRNAHKDWLALFPLTDLPRNDRGYTHVSVSWGERAFFLETPSWSDLNPVTAIGALTGGDGIVHIAHYVRPAPSDTFRVLHLRPAQYRRLTDAIERQLVPDHASTLMPGYGDRDVFYDALGTYHLGSTCNQWTADQLAKAGVKTGWWTPMAGGVMHWVPPAE
ncbi:MAG: TIGR02117 family protein [Erythrobacter sp.]